MQTTTTAIKTAWTTDIWERYYMSKSTVLAIKTGRCFTAVTVDREAGQVTVARADGDGRIFANGVTSDVIRSAARDGAGRSYKTLRDLMVDYPHATRAGHHDC